MLDHLTSFPSSKEMISQRNIEPSNTPFGLGTSSLSSDTLRTSRIVYKSLYYPNLMKKNRKMSTCDQLDLEILGYQPIVYAQKYLQTLPSQAKHGHDTKSVPAPAGYCP